MSLKNPSTEKSHKIDEKVFLCLLPKGMQVIYFFGKNSGNHVGYATGTGMI